MLNRNYKDWIQRRQLQNFDFGLGAHTLFYFFTFDQKFIKVIWKVIIEFWRISIILRSMWIVTIFFDFWLRKVLWPIKSRINVRTRNWWWFADFQTHIRAKERTRNKQQEQKKTWKIRHGLNICYVMSFIFDSECTFSIFLSFFYILNCT